MTGMSGRPAARVAELRRERRARDPRRHGTRARPRTYGACDSQGASADDRGPRWHRAPAAPARARLAVPHAPRERSPRGWPTPLTRPARPTHTTSYPFLRQSSAPTTLKCHPHRTIPPPPSRRARDPRTRGEGGPPGGATPPHAPKSPRRTHPTSPYIYRQALHGPAKAYTVRDGPSPAVLQWAACTVGCRVTVGRRRGFP